QNTPSSDGTAPVRLGVAECMRSPVRNVVVTITSHENGHERRGRASMKLCLRQIRGLATIAASVSLAVLVLTATSTSAGAATKKLSPIKIGIICSCTGPLASSTSVGPPSYQAWADSVNAAGGINGHKIN